MGMPIEKAIRQVKGYRNRQKYEDDYAWSYPFLSSIDTLLEVADKYQKIQEIINNTDYIEEDVIRYKMICGVVKDGNNN